MNTIQLDSNSCHIVTSLRYKSLCLPNKKASKSRECSMKEVIRITSSRISHSNTCKYKQNSNDISRRFALQEKRKNGSLPQTHFVFPFNIPKLTGKHLPMVNLILRDPIILRKTIFCTWHNLARYQNPHPAYICSFNNSTCPW